MTRKWTLNASDELAIREGCYLSERHGEKVCKFIEGFCRLSQGRWAGQPLKLMGWQTGFLTRLFGWRRADGKRRFRSAFLLAAKKSGKSPLASALGLYLLLADGEAAPEIYICACDRDQAGIIFTESERMVQFSPSLQKRTDVIPSRKTILAGHGRIVANSADAPKLDGLNASAVLWDELHRQPDRMLWDVMKYATAAREQPLTISITTAGEEEDGVWFEQLERSLQVEAGIVQDTSHLGVIFRASEGDDIDSVKTWHKANPSLGVTFSEQDFRRDLEEAKSSPAMLANFRRLRLNLVTRSESKFIDMTLWKACGGDWLRAPLEASSCHLGLDLSSRDDLAALVGIWGDAVDGYDVGAKFYLPEDGIVELERKHGQPYRQWADEGLISLTPGPTIDREVIKKAIVEMGERLRVRTLFIDPWDAHDLGESLKETHGLPVEWIRQGFLSLNEPTKLLWELVIGGKIRHQGNAILAWHASNAIVKTDAAGNIKLDKSKRRHKIDGMAALVNALAGAISVAGKDDLGRSVYEDRGVIYFDMKG